MDRIIVTVGKTMVKATGRAAIIVAAAVGTGIVFISKAIADGLRKHGKDKKLPS